MARTTQEFNEATLHQWLTIGLQVILLVGLVGSTLYGAWLNAFLTAGVLLLTLLPAVLSRRFSVYIPPEFELAAILFIFASFFLGSIHGYYERFWWWDLLLHSASGFLLGLVGFLFIYVLNQEERIGLHMKPGFVAMFSFAFALAVGALWEVFEFFLDEKFGMSMQAGLRDTMWDLIVDAGGALVVSLLGYGYLKKAAESFIETRLLSFIRGNPKLFKGVSPRDP